MKTIEKILTVGLSMLALVTTAHPGHGNGNPLSPDHYFGNPEHSIPILLGISAVLAYSVWKWKKQRVK